MATISSTNIVSNRQPYLDVNGKPLALGRLAIYDTGSSTSLANVFDDAALERMITNPVLLDTAGRACAIYSESGAYVKVEKFIGIDEHGENLYALVYDYETPPGVDISSYWNVNFVDYYEPPDGKGLMHVLNKNPTFVLKEGDPHIYFWNPNKPSMGLNEATDVSSRVDASGSWHWETKRVYADQCGIRNDGTRYNISRWSALAMLSKGGCETIIPSGTYEFTDDNGKQQTPPPMEFNSLEIRSNVTFNGMAAAAWNIGVSRRAACESSGLNIKWTKLPADRAYDTQYFSNIELAGTASPVDLLVTTNSFACNRIRNAYIDYIGDAYNDAASCVIKEITSSNKSAKLSFKGTCEKAHCSDLVPSGTGTRVLWLLLDEEIDSSGMNGFMDRLSILPGGLLKGTDKVTVKELVECVPNAISCPFEISPANGNTFSLDPNIFSDSVYSSDNLDGMDRQLKVENWKAVGIGNKTAFSKNFVAQNGQSFYGCDFSGSTITASNASVSFTDCKIGTLICNGNTILKCIGCDITTLRFSGGPSITGMCCKIGTIMPTHKSGSANLINIRLTGCYVENVSYNDLDSSVTMTNIPFVVLNKASGGYYWVGSNASRTNNYDITGINIKPLGFNSSNQAESMVTALYEYNGYATYNSAMKLIAEKNSSRLERTAGSSPDNSQYPTNRRLWFYLPEFFRGV
jgi:hypothetical protein